MESDLQTSNGRKICIYQDSPGFIGPVDMNMTFGFFRKFI